jgi:hypothetical protein
MWRTLGPGAFDAPKKARPKAEPKPRFVIFRLNDDEFNQLKAMAKAAGARSLADFARRRLLAEPAQSSVRAARQEPKWEAKQEHNPSN